MRLCRRQPYTNYYILYIILYKKCDVVKESLKKQAVSVIATNTRQGKENSPMWIVVTMRDVLGPMRAWRAAAQGPQKFQARFESRGGAKALGTLIESSNKNALKLSVFKRARINKSQREILTLTGAYVNNIITCSALKQTHFRSQSNASISII